MKKITAALLCLSLVFCFAACSKGGNAESSENQDTTKKIDSLDLTENESKAEAPSAPKGLVPVTFDEEIGEAYKNVVIGGNYEGHEDEKITCKGTFTTIEYSFDNTTRYYVWGYSDNSLTDCWQWELKVTDPSSLPKNGTLVNLTGTIEKSDSALDKIWLKDYSITEEQKYSGEACNIDMATMSPTLIRVQVSSIFSDKSAFEGKSVSIAGRIISKNLIGHPTDDNGWQMHFHTDGKVPKAGTKDVIVVGVLHEGTIDEAKVQTF